jgi:hypothetical protein
VASVEIVPDAATIEPDETVQLEAILRDHRGYVVSNRAKTWTSSDVSVATVDQSGLVTGLAVGQATIEAAAEGVTGAALITVVPDVLGSLASVYSAMHNTQWDYYNLSEITTDEMIVPTRGSDWFDNGRWIEMHRHTWTANSPSGLVDINGVWNDAFSGITRANVLLDALQNASVPNQAVIEAELRTLRAFYYYMLVDMFGGVPIVTTPEIAPRPRSVRAEVFQFIESELQETRMVLPISWPAPDYWRMTRGAADAILASMYLNAGVFTSDAPSATVYNSCMSVQVGGQNACRAAIVAADRILNSGQYGLATDWHSNFAPDNFDSPENILVVENLNQTGLGLNFVTRALHYNQLSPPPWNGFAALAEAYNAFDADDQRREIFLEGPQVNLDTGEPAFERNGTPLVFTVDIIDELQAGEGEGTRIIKYPPDPNRAGRDNGNDFAYFRLGEILLIKAEALNELNPGSGEALALLNTLRERVFEPDEPLTTVDRDVILQERLLELTAEAKRREDLIRHGRFTDPWSFKQPGAPHLVLMPIPQPQLDANPLLAKPSSTTRRAPAIYRSFSAVG